MKKIAKSIKILLLCVYREIYEKIFFKAVANVKTLFLFFANFAIFTAFLIIPKIFPNNILVPFFFKLKKIRYVN